MPKIEAIKIHYPGSVISVNHYLGRRRDGGVYVKAETRAWKEEFGWLLKRLSLTEWSLPLYVMCSAVFKNERSACDISNFSKVVLDTIEETTGINDKNMRWQDGTRIIDKKQEPYLVLVISESPVNATAIKPGLARGKVKASDNTQLPKKRNKSKKEGKDG